MCDVPVLHDTASVELKYICDRHRRTSLRVLSDVNPTGVAVNSGVEYGEVGDSGQAGKSIDGLIQRSWRSGGGVLDPAWAEMVDKCGFDVLSIIEFLNKLIEDGYLLGGCCGARRAVARSRSYGKDRQKDVELHDDVIKMTVTA